MRVLGSRSPIFPWYRASRSSTGVTTGNLMSVSNFDIEATTMCRCANILVYMSIVLAYRFLNHSLFQLCLAPPSWKQSRLQVDSGGPTCLLTRFLYSILTLPLNHPTQRPPSRPTHRSLSCLFQRPPHPMPSHLSRSNFPNTFVTTGSSSY